jgi:hypothetical protein
LLRLAVRLRIRVWAVLLRDVETGVISGVVVIGVVLALLCVVLLAVVVANTANGVVRTHITRVAIEKRDMNIWK